MCHLLVFKTRYGLGLMLDDNTMKNIVCSHRSIKSCFDPSKHFYETTEIKLYICFTKYILIKLHRCLCGFYKLHHHQIFGEKLEVFLGPILSDLNFDAHKLEKF